MKRAFILFILLTLLAAGTAGAQETFRPGDRCLAYWKATKMFYVGTVVEEDFTKKTVGYYVVFADGDQAALPGRLVKPLTIKVGSKVMAMWSDKRMYPGKVARIVGGALFIHFDDGDKGWTSWAGIAVKPD